MSATIKHEKIATLKTLLETYRSRASDLEIENQRLLRELSLKEQQISALEFRIDALYRSESRRFCEEEIKRNPQAILALLTDLQSSLSLEIMPNNSTRPNPASNSGFNWPIPSSESLTPIQLNISSLSKNVNLMGNSLNYTAEYNSASQYIAAPPNSPGYKHYAQDEDLSKSIDYDWLEPANSIVEAESGLFLKEKKEGGNIGEDSKTPKGSTLTDASN